jgi:hypothetical protein
LCDRRDDVDAATAAIESHGGQVGRVLPLRGKTDGVPNCLHPDVIECWQAKGYNYRAGYCLPQCERGEDDLKSCPFIQSIAALAEADNIVVTKALARRAGFFSTMGNRDRQTVLLDEDPIALMRPLVVVTREELHAYLAVLDRIDERLRQDEARNIKGAVDALRQAQQSRKIARWCWDQIARQPANGTHDAVAVPDELRPSRAVLRRTKAARKHGRMILYQAFYRLMWQDPAGTVRNVFRDLFELTTRAAAGTAFVTAEKVVFHLRVTIPKSKDIFVLDATASADLLRPVFAPRPVEVVCQERVAPAGRVVQFMDSNGPRSYLNKIPPKVVRILDALGDLHPAGKIVLISHQSCVAKLAAASKHACRIQTAYFGALRGRNDLEYARDDPVACHVVVGSPKTTEDDRRMVALAVYGRSILPFVGLVTGRRTIVGPTPHELTEADGERRIWEVRLKGYTDPRMQAVFEHTVTAELTQAADRARVLIHPQAVVYLATNEPCPHLWFAEMCYADELLDLSATGTRADFRLAYAAYSAKAAELLNEGKAIGNADVCRALGRKPGWGKRYWQQFLREMGDALEGERKVRWKEE